MALSTPHDDYFSDARNRMVDSQLRPNKVSDPRILDAMRQLPREMFLPDSFQSRAEELVVLFSGADGFLVGVHARRNAEFARSKHRGFEFSVQFLGHLFEIGPGRLEIAIES